MSENIPTRFEDLANEIILDILDYLDIRHFYRAFFGLNERINRFLCSLDNISLVLLPSDDDNDQSIEYFSPRNIRLMVADGSCKIDLKRFSNVRSLKIECPTDSLLVQIQPTLFPQLDYLFLGISNRWNNSLNEIHQAIFSNGFPLLRTCILFSEPLTNRRWLVSASLRILIIGTYPHLLHVNTYRAILISCPNLVRLTLFGRFDHNNLVQQSTYSHQLNYLSLQSDEPSLNVVIDHLLSQVPNLKRLCLKGLPMAYPISAIDFVQLARVLHQRVPNLQRFDCHTFAILKNTVDINTIHSLHPRFAVIKYQHLDHPDFDALTTKRVTEKPLALHFSLKPTQQQDVVRSLFHIQNDIKNIVFADISHSKSNQEHDSLQNIKIYLSTEGHNITEEYLELAQQETEKLNVEDSACIEFNIGRVFYFEGEWDKARDYYNSAYNRMTKSKPASTKDSAWVLNNIGITLYTQGLYDESLIYHQRALEIREKFYSSGHADIVASLNNIGFTLYKQGKYDEALAYNRRALEIYEQLHPSGHADIAWSLDSIGLTLYKQEKYSETLDYYRRALKIRERRYPSGDVDIATILNNIGSTLRRLNRNGEALNFYQRALEIREKLYPSGHPESVSSLKKMGITLLNQGKYEEALDCHRRALEMLEKLYPSGHPDIASSVNKMDVVLPNEVT
ncbi:unnamed protein product [Rotaria magnacalcarata]|uniref:Uncharacterized protein n=3 Tax=Rotaria magnacalcarata TaxID=392030 RepID=A0A8S2M8N9_9BILA|nr:unnamed protein product [Rotaria magnacalcarata]